MFKIFGPTSCQDKKKIDKKQYDISSLNHGNTPHKFCLGQIVLTKWSQLNNQKQNNYTKNKVKILN